MKPLSSELTEKDALNRIKWDKSLNASDYVICYVVRESEQLKEVAFTDIELRGDFFFSAGSLIPLHRIRRITCGSVIAWDRRKV